MGPIIDYFIDRGFVDWIPRYWPWSGYLVILFLILLYANWMIIWWEDEDNQKKIKKLKEFISKYFQRH